MMNISCLGAIWAYFQGFSHAGFVSGRVFSVAFWMVHWAIMGFLQLLIAKAKSSRTVGSISLASPQNATAGGPKSDIG